jgi:predicted SAM-dependent methyltransferase
MMKRRLIDLFNKSLLWFKRNQLLRPEGKSVRVNLGSGLTVVDGWINVDSSLNAVLSKFPKAVAKAFYGLSSSRQWYSREEYVTKLKNHLFVHHELEYGVPFSDQTIDFVYSSHVLEHFYRDEAERFLRDTHRAMRSGGRLRICVPDLELAIRLFNSGETEQALEFFFASSQEGYYSTHRYLYDFILLKQLLERVGFKNVEKCSYRQGQVPDIELLDNRPEQTLYMEAEKPVQLAT